MRLVQLLAAFAAVAHAQIGTSNCNQPRFNYCNSELGRFWSVDMGQAWTDINNLDRITQQLLTLPYRIDNFVNVCNGWANFYSCLGPQNIANCLGTVGFVGTGMDPISAYAYQGFLADWGFKCGAGFFAVYETQALTSCVQNTYVNYQQELQGAFAGYITNTTNDPNNACTYAQTLMNSLQDVYRTGPCRSVDPASGGWYGCQSAREYTNAQFQHCRHITKCATPVSVQTRVNARGKQEVFVGPRYAVKNNVAFVEVAEEWVEV